MDSGKSRFWEGSYGASHSAGHGPPAASVMLTLGARGALLVPLRVGPLQQVLCSGTAQVCAAVLHHHLAIDVGGRIRNQETREISKLAVFPGAAERIARRPALIAALGGQLAGSAFGRKRAGRDRDQPYALRPP